VTISRIYHTK